MVQEENAAFLVELEKLHQRQELSLTVGPNYFEPGMMEYLLRKLRNFRFGSR